jgi:hypothetical protein
VFRLTPYNKYLLDFYLKKPENIYPEKNFNTISNHDLPIAVANLAAFPKGVRYSGIKVYNNFPLTFKRISRNVFKFKVAFI